uniref:Deacetylase sirtuin-type domain-containing protein n=1 Tax=Poecilia mexicana TaxID=48701 RepID=A0A3B3XU48_9TELE
MGKLTEAKLRANFLPFVVEILQSVPLRRHLWRGAAALLLFERIIIRGLFGGGGESVQPQTLQDVAENIRERRCKRVVVMAGAGISTPSGIPDFRSPGSGLYDNLQQYDLPYAEAIFEIGFFHRNPNPFFALAKELYPGNYQPNLTHYFVRLLHQKGQLLRMYTQNIDGLERLAGVPPEMLVEAHGTFATATCTSCLRKYDGEELRPEVMSGAVPRCPTCKGVVKPDIVFFGEELPLSFFKYLTDFPLADLLIVMGTSLEVSRLPVRTAERIQVAFTGSVNGPGKKIGIAKKSELSHFRLQCERTLRDQ